MNEKINAEAIKSLAKVLREEDLTEVEYQTNDFKIKVVKHNQEIVHIASKEPASISVTATETQSLSGVLKSPMVGTVYLAPSPGSPPFVKIGDSVKEGQTLLVIEAMKVMNMIKAQKPGVIKNVFVKDMQPIEFGEPLMAIDD